ncbi:protein arginine N-methyltransferase 1-B-like [Musca autumnalis]|uniref:protein arginine N-methyltransferase 1-B-like n=1 Tax=Musca autumnalis TaxID=221902 RepID=UPI003CE8F2CD
MSSTNFSKQKKPQNRTANLCKKKTKKHLEKQHDPADDANDSGHDTASSTTKTNAKSPVDMMTSKDFQFDVGAHVEMIHQQLKDGIRIQKFKEAILYNQHLFKNKTVLHLSCGVGIFSLFAAKAGAAKVYAIDRSNVIYYTRQIVAANGYEDIIEVIKGNIEEVNLPVKEVDIILCDWMGYALLFQATCDAVIYARDKWLKKSNGLIFPDQAKLFMIAVEDQKHKNENIEWWNGVYGFNMRCLRNVALKEPRYQLVQPEQILSKQCPIKSLDLYTATKDDLKFRSKYMLPIQRSGHMDAFALYFHVYFTKSHTPLGFSTDPWSAGTNWMQTILFLDESIGVKANSIYYGGIEMISQKSPPNLNDMIINVELLTGDPAIPEVDIEMSWNLRPAVMAMDPIHLNGINNNDNHQEKDAFKDIAISNKINFSKCDTTLTAIDNITKTFEMSRLEEPPPAKPQKQKFIATKVIPNEGQFLASQTFTIGENIYVCRKNRRNKNKHNKKG